MRGKMLNWLTYLHLSDVETRVDGEDFEPPVVDARRVELLVSRAELPGPDARAPRGDVQEDEGLEVGQLHPPPVQPDLQDAVEVAALALQHVLGAVDEVEQLVEEAPGEAPRAARVLPRLVKVVGDERVDADAEIVLHEQLLALPLPAALGLLPSRGGVRREGGEIHHPAVKFLNPGPRLEDRQQGSARIGVLSQLLFHNM